jgi:hypothetical protein
MNLYKYKENSLYKDRFTPDSNWLKVLFTPGRPVQSAELIELQSIIRHSYKLGMDKVLGALSIVQGLNYTLSIEEDTTFISISEGIIYTEGSFIPVKSKDLEFSLNEEVSIGVLLNEVIITENEDNSLKSNHPYGLPGAHRLVWEGDITLNNPLSFEIYRYEKGEIIQSNNYPFKELLSEISTFIDSIYGSFLLYGLKTSFISTQEPLSESITVDNSSLISDINSIESQISSLKIRKRDLESSINQLISSNLSSNLILAETYIQQLREANQEETTLSNSLLEKRIALSRLIERNPINSRSIVNLSISPGSAFVKGYKTIKPYPSLIQYPYSIETKEVKGARFINSSTYIPSKLSLIPSIDYATIKAASINISIKFNQIIFNNQLVDVVIQANTSSFLSIEDIINSISAFELSSLTLTSTVLNQANISLSPIEIKQLLSLNFNITKTNSNSITIQIKDSSSRTSIRLDTYSSSQYLSWSQSTSFSSISNINRYLLPSVNVSKITRIVGELKADGYRLTRGESNRDFLGEDSIFSLLLVYQDNTIYIPGVDYRLDTQQYINWIGNKPQPGDSYYVNYMYTEELSKDEYSISNNEILINIPIPPGYGFEVDYLYSIDKKLTVTIDTNSDIEIYETSIPEGVLSLSNVYIKGKEVEVVELDNKIPSLSDIYLLSQQVDQHTNLLNTLLSNQEQYLDNQENNLLATWNIDLSTFNDIDIDLTTGAIDVFIKSFNPSFRTKEISILANDCYKDKLNLCKFYTLPFISIPFISNNRATRYISSYGYSNISTYIYPAFLWANNDSSYPYLANNENVEGEITCSIYKEMNEILDSIDSKYSVDTYNPLGNIVPIEYTFYLLVEGLLTYEDGITILFDSKSIPSINLIKGSVINNILRADVNGVIYLSLLISIPQPGNYLISIFNSRFNKSINLPIYNSYELPIYNNLSKYDYRSRKREIEINNEGVTTSFSAINQYFNTTRDFFITKLELRLREIGNNNLIVGIDKLGLNSIPELRLVESKPNDYYYSNDSSAITTTEFLYPTLINKGDYSIGIDGEEYKLYASFNQEKDYLTGSLFNSYSLLSQDRLFISKDGKSTSELLYTNLSYQIYRAEFIVGSSVYIPLGVYGLSNGFTNISHFSYNTKDIVPPGTLIQYEYKTSSDWIPFKSNTITRLISIAPSIELRVLINSSSSFVSPIVNIEGSTIALYSDNSTYKLYTESKSFPFTFNKVVVKVDIYNKKDEDTLSLYNLKTLNNEIQSLQFVSSINRNTYITSEYKLEQGSLDTLNLVFDCYSPGIDKLILRNIRVYIYG